MDDPALPRHFLAVFQLKLLGKEFQLRSAHPRSVNNYPSVLNGADVGWGALVQLLVCLCVMRDSLAGVCVHVDRSVNHYEFIGLFTKLTSNHSRV